MQAREVGDTGEHARRQRREAETPKAGGQEAEEWTGSMDGIDERGSIAAEWDRCVGTWTGQRLDYWLRLEWRHPVSEFTALAHLDGLRRRLRRESRGLVFLTGLHRHPMIHCHGVTKLSRRLKARLLNAKEV